MEFFSPPILYKQKGTMRFSDLYDDPRYLDEIEANLSWLLDTAEAEPMTVPANQAYVFKGDLYGLLKSVGAPLNQIPVIARMNGYHSSDEYDGLRTEFVVPGQERVAHLTRLFRTRFQ